MGNPLSIDTFKNIQGFNWDSGNLNKNLIRHNVTWQEAEASFRNRPIIILEDIKHSDKETRYTLYGKTDESRKITIIFTLRRDCFRIVSARDQNKAERRFYDQQKA
jgi:hypothetical protein